MKISTFRAKDMRDALEEVKAALGSDAVILSTRRVRERTMTGLPSNRTLIEITACPSPSSLADREMVAAQQNIPQAGPSSLKYAAQDEEPPTVLESRTRGSRFSTVVDDPILPERSMFDPVEPQTRRSGASAGREPQFSRQEPQTAGREPQFSGREPQFPGREAQLSARDTQLSAREAQLSAREAQFSARENQPHAPSDSEVIADAVADAMATNMASIRNTLATLEERVSNLPAILAREVQKIPDVPGLDAEGKRSYGWLLMHGVEEPIARKLAMVERSVKGQGLETALKRLLQFRDPLDGTNRVIVLVGPTGVGKTTTLAKIAAELLLNRRRSVGFITLDTFRVGAVAQLETYARLLQMRLVVARSASEVRAGLHSLNRCDHILVDTVGSSPYNRRQVATTGELLPAIGEQRETLLCMAGNVRETEQRAIFRRFLPLQPSGLIFTKLDETVTYGGILNVALRARLPLTFYTDGQRVPENLGWLSTEVIAKWFERNQSQGFDPE